jgi:Mrp family chromosome partitioning ATPase
MSTDVDLVLRKTNGTPFEIVRTRKNLPVAQMRPVPTAPQAHKELVKLVQRLFLSGSPTPQAVVFSAVEAGSGCTFVCTRTAEILANQLEEPVCLVHANFRSSGLNEHFEIDGNSKAPYGDEWAFMTVADNLWLLSYKPATEDCPRLTSLERFESIIHELRREFTYVLIDAPPLNDYADAALFAKMADGLVMVVEANDTRRDTAQKAKDILDSHRVTILGAVLNNRTFPIPESVYRRL